MLCHSRCCSLEILFRIRLYTSSVSNIYVWSVQHSIKFDIFSMLDNFSAAFMIWNGFSRRSALKILPIIDDFDSNSLSTPSNRSYLWRRYFLKHQIRPHLAGNCRLIVLLLHIYILHPANS